jgi:hypothetical protein
MLIDLLIFFGKVAWFILVALMLSMLDEWRREQ